MKKIVFLLSLLMLFVIGVNPAFAQKKKKKKSTTKTETTTTKPASKPAKEFCINQPTDSISGYTYTVGVNIYPIWITRSGRCYIVRLSKEGREDRQYMPEDIARQICAELGKEYIEKIH